MRSELQNYWAQIVERLADRWGRGVRYGDDPEDAHLPAEGVAYPDGTSVTRQRIIYDLRSMADQVAEIEESEQALQDSLRKPSLEWRIAKTFGREVEDLDKDAVLFYPRFRISFKLMISSLWRDGALAARRAGTREPITDRRHVGRILRRVIPDVRAPDADFVRERLLRCDSLVDDVVAEQRSRLKRQQATLRDMLHRLGEYVEQGGIR